MTTYDVTIAGELNLDLILYGLPDALPPERELLASEMALTLGSSSAIVAHNLAALGSRVGFTSCIGQDDLGDLALNRLLAAGVDVSTVRRLSPPAKTALTVLLPRDGWRNILTYPGTIFELRPEHLDVGYLASARHFHLSSYFLQKELRGHVPALFRELKGAGLTISLDTNDDPADEWGNDIESVLPMVDVFLPNAREAIHITRSKSLEEAMDRLAGIVPLVVVKLGAEGACARRGKQAIHSQALKVQVVDSVGAGDSFDAGFLREFLNGSDLVTCLESGNLAGALSTTRSGGTDAFRDQEHRERFYCERSTQNSSIEGSPQRTRPR